MPESPLEEALPSSLEEYFSRDPNGLSDRDVGIVCQALRQQRAKWLTDEAAAPKGRSRAGTAKTVLSAAPANISIDDLDLGV